MKKWLAVLVLYCCPPIFLLAAHANPLIKKELSPISNPGFEDGLRHWGGKSADTYKTAPASDGETLCNAADVSFEGDSSLAIPMSQFIEPGALHVARAFQVQQGGKFYVSAKVRTKGNASAFLRVVTSADETPQVFAVQTYGSLRTVSVRPDGFWIGKSDHTVSEILDPETDWREIGVTFVTTGQTMNVSNPDPNTAACELRIGAFGQGTAYVDDIRVYALNDYSQYVRVKLIEPDPAKYRLYMIARAARPKEYHIRTFFSDEGVSAGQYSPWIWLNEGGRFSGNPSCVYPGTITAGFRFEPLDGKKIEKINVQMDFAYGPDESKILKTITEENEGDIFSVYFARDGAGPIEFKDSFRLMRDDAFERNAMVRSLNLPRASLKKFHIETTVGGYGSFYSDPRIVEAEMNTVGLIGFNALTHLSNPYREVAAREGIFKTHHVHRESTLQSLPKVSPDELAEAKTYPFNARAMEVYPSYRKFMERGTGVVSLRWDDMKRNFSHAVGQWMTNMKNSDPGQISITTSVDVGDEIGGVPFAGTEYNEQYREYLKGQGIKPRDVGKAKWEDVYPVTWGGSNNPLPKMRPRDRSDVAACAQYYWSLKFWSWCNAKMHRVVSRELEKRLPDVTTRVNFGQPWYNAATDMRGTDCWEFARQRGVTAICNEDWVCTYTGGRFTGLQLNSYISDLDRSVAAVENLALQAYVMAEKEGHIQRKLASVIGKGVKEINLFSYGPGYGSFDNWAHSFSMVKGVAKFIRHLDKAEDVLYPGQPRNPEVAIIWSGSNEIWREKEPTSFDSHKGDTLYNGHYIHFGLLHDHIPIDFIDEFEIEKGGLSKYKVVYLSARNLRRKSQAALADWVNDGGFLWSDALSGVEDEYGQDCDILLPVIGIRDCRTEESALLDYRPEYGLPRQEQLDTITIKDTGEKVAAIGTTVKFALRDPKSTEVLATFEDGSPAVIEREVGNGKVHYVATLAGCSYGWTVDRVWGKIETGYRQANRRLISDFPSRVGARMPLTCSVPLVEANLLESDKGIGIVLANYAGEDPIDEVKFSISVPSKIKSVTSMELGKLPFTFHRDTKTVDVSLPLELVDILVLN